MQRNLDEFFRSIVLEKYPYLLVDISDYWLNQVYFKVPNATDQSNGENLYI